MFSPILVVDDEMRIIKINVIFSSVLYSSLLVDDVWVGTPI